MSIADIRKLPLSEKLQIREAIWEELRQNAENVAVTDWQKKLLDTRRKAVVQGCEKILNWDEIKDSPGDENSNCRGGKARLR